MRVPASSQVSVAFKSEQINPVSLRCSPSIVRGCRYLSHPNANQPSAFVHAHSCVQPKMPPITLLHGYHSSPATCFKPARGERSTWDWVSTVLLPFVLNTQATTNHRVPAAHSTRPQVSIAVGKISVHLSLRFHHIAFHGSATVLFSSLVHST